MNISYKWLKEYVDFDMSATEVAVALTSIGLEVGAVEEVQTIKGGLKGLFVGQVMTCKPHPDSDHMHITTIDLGNSEEAVQVVCGAHNVAQGQKVIVATIGTKLYDGEREFVIKKTKLRGVESYGMICAEDEIGVGTGHDGIIVLPDDALVGMPAAQYFNLESDYLIEVDITPNRADACSHWGVARDLYAYFVRNGHKTALHRPTVEGFKTDSRALPIEVEIENPEACPRYCAITLKDCVVKESPKWLQDKLNTIGIRPINNIVDVTNYITMAYGQPLHCFDADMIKGGKVCVKTLPKGTKFVTLDNEEHELSDRDLMICNAEEPMCIAGVLGGKGSGTYETTTNILLESAYFHPTWIRKSARRHGLSTDASFRFERGVDPDGQIYALQQAALLIQELAGGSVAMDMIDLKSEHLTTNFGVTLSFQYIDDVIGKKMDHDMVRTILESLEYKIVREDLDNLYLEVPAYRVDVQRPCDVVEDILRIYGYNNVEIPTSIKSSLTVKGKDDRNYRLQILISEQLVGSGFHEILNNSLTKESYYKDLEVFAPKHLVRLLNPLSADLNVMRQTLLFGGLESIARNVNRKVSNLRFFEFGNCYRFDHKDEKEEQVLRPYTEDLHLALWITGNRVEGSWAHPTEKSSLYELKAYVVNILQRLGVSLKGLLLEEGKNNIFAKSLAISDHNGKILVELGQVSKFLLSASNIEQDVFYADFNWKLLMNKLPKKTISFKELFKYPSVRRDLALLLDKSVSFAEIERIAFSTEKKLLKRVELFDVYEGKNLDAGKKSYAVAFTLQDDTKTMNDKQTESIMNKIIVQLEKQLGAVLRG